MKYLYAVESEEELREYQQISGRLIPRFEGFLEKLKSRWKVKTLPCAVLWTSAENATSILSSIPVPAYTNERRTVFSPRLEEWKQIYLKQLTGCPDAEQIASYYREELTENHLLQILGHEMVHHSALFLEGFDADRSSGIWFEEGMCEYISRRYFLSPAQFEREAQVNEWLVQRLCSRYGAYPLEKFGADTYSEDLAGIFYWYWRSFLAVNRLVEAAGGDPMQVFRSYRQWGAFGAKEPLEGWFGL